MRIGEVARRTGVSTKTIRYYESIGLLPEPPRTAAGYRDYDAGVVERLRFVRDAQATGLTLTEIASILDLRARGESTCEHVVTLLEDHLRDLDEHIATLVRTRAQLSELTDRARRLDPADCVDPNRCQTIATQQRRNAASPRRDHVHEAPHRHRHEPG